MKIFLIILGVFVIVLGGLGYFAYRHFPQINEMIASKLAQSSKVNMDQAASKFVESCESSAKKKLQEKGLFDEAMEKKIHNYCVCARDEFKQRFTPQELIAIGLNKMTAQDPKIDPQKMSAILEACQSNLLP